MLMIWLPVAVTGVLDLLQSARCGDAFQADNYHDSREYASSFR
jgi:hypothetical protein